MSAPNKDLLVASRVELPKGEDGIWMMIQKLSRLGTWTIADVACFSGVSHGVVSHYVLRLERAGYVRRRTDGTRKVGDRRHNLFEQAKPSLNAPRLTRAGEVLPELKIQTIWRTMRMLKRFTVLELADYVGTEEVPGHVPSIRRYVCDLARVGILIREEGGKGGQNYKTYRLHRQLGPCAPKILSARIIFDPNSRSTVGTASSQEAAQ